MGSLVTEVHYGRFEGGWRRQAGSPDAKASRVDAEADLNHTRRGEVIYEPFLGSGTTLIAAE